MRYPGLYFALLPFLAAAHVHAQTAATPGAIVEGEVVNAATGTPIAGARVKLDPRLAEPLYLKTDAGGHFLFRNLPPALYLWSVEAPGFLQPAQSAFLDLTVPQAGPICAAPGSVRPSAVPFAGPFTIASDADGTTHARIAIPLTAYAVVTGKVTDPDGVPLEDWDVGILVKQATPKTGSSGSFAQPLPDGHHEISPKTTVRTNDKGEFRAARLEPGTYYVVANKPSMPGTAESGYRATYYPRAIDMASAKPLDLAAGDRARADIRIASQSGIRIAGRLVKPAGAEDSGDRLLYTQIVLAPETNLVNANRTSTAGKDDYEFNDVLPGRYTLMAVTQDASSDPFGGHPKAIFGLMRPIEAGDSDMNGVDLVPQPLSDLAGAVTFSEGCAPFPLTIRTNSFSTLSGGQAETVSGADGKFVLRGLGTGKFTVSVFSSSLMVGPVSIRLGERDVEKEGFESPLSGDEPLLIEVACANSRKPR